MDEMQDAQYNSSPLMVKVNVDSCEKPQASPTNLSLEHVESLSRCPSGITLEEIVPERDTISSKNIAKTLSCSGIPFLHARSILEKEISDKKLPRNVRRYYKQQQQYVNAFDDSMTDSDVIESSIPDSQKEAVRRIVLLSLFCNILLVIGKSVASYLSGSLSIISSLVDSAMDLVSSLLFWYTSRSIKGTNFYHYPVGKTRLEPVAVIILSVVMTVASIQLIINSITTIIRASADPRIEIPTIVLLGVTIVTKVLLYLYCRRGQSLSSKALSQDHRNDVLSNAFALGFGYLGYKVYKNADPIGGIIISLYIAFSWWKTGSDQVRSLTGHTAQPDLLQHLLLVCMHHDQRIQFIDTLRAYHFGNNLIVEAHIVLPPTMTLQEAHDIGEPLQQKLEKFPNVERAFVHIDYEYEHSPSDEHKMGHDSPRK